MATGNVFVVRAGSSERIGPRWNYCAELTEGGVQEVRQFAWNHMHSLSGCNIFGCSPLPRAQQTVEEIMGVLNKPVKDNIIVSKHFFAVCPRVFVKNGPVGDPQAFVEGHRNLATFEGDMFFHRGILGQILGKMTNGAKVALCVSHGGPIDLLLAHAKSVTGDGSSFENIRALGPAEGMKLVFEAGKLTAVHEIRFPFSDVAQ